MRITAIFIVLVMVASSLSGCAEADAACEKVVELDNAAGYWDDAFLIVAERIGGATGHFEVVAIVKVVQGAKKICAAKNCAGMDADACASFSSSFDPSPTRAMLVGMMWDSARQIGDEVESSEMEESWETEWGEWDLSNPVFF